MNECTCNSPQNNNNCQLCDIIYNICNKMENDNYLQETIEAHLKSKGLLPIDMIVLLGMIMGMYMKQYGFKDEHEEFMNNLFDHISDYVLRSK